jgi:hypothetical protein
VLRLIDVEVFVSQSPLLETYTAVKGFAVSYSGIMLQYPDVFTQDSRCVSWPVASGDYRTYWTRQILLFAFFFACYNFLVFRDNPLMFDICVKNSKNPGQDSNISHE